MKKKFLFFVVYGLFCTLQVEAQTQALDEFMKKESCIKKIQDVFVRSNDNFQKCYDLANSEQEFISCFQNFNLVLDTLNGLLTSYQNFRNETKSNDKGIEMSISGGASKNFTKEKAEVFQSLVIKLQVSIKTTIQALKEKKDITKDIDILIVCLKSEVNYWNKNIIK